MAKITRQIQNFLIVLLQSYQYVLSPWLGTHCRFYPTCSSYAIEAIKTQGVLKGLWLTVRRLCRCHPWCKGGCDPVPLK